MLIGRNRMKVILAVTIVAMLVIGCASQPTTKFITNSHVPIDQVPMYGDMDRNAIPTLKEADEVFIEGTSKEFGSREKASAVFVDYAFRLYKENNCVKAMQRFNQAWLLNPDNPEVYWGFASVLHDWERYCEAMKMVEKALSYKQYFTGFYPDAGRVITLCAVNDTSLSEEEKKKLFARADSLYAEAEVRDNNKAYTYASWATAYYWRGQYEGAWKMVKKVRAEGDNVSDQFLSLLKSKMTEP